MADGYRWINNGSDRLPRRNPVVYKRKFKIATQCGESLKFKRLAFCDIVPSEECYIIVQYIGEEKLAGNLPHGNSKQSDSTRPFVRSVPSVLTRLAIQVLFI